MHTPLRKTRRLLIGIGVGLIAAVGISYFVYTTIQQRVLRARDEQVVRELEPVIRTTLLSLAEDSEITQRYGRFKELTDISWRRPNYPMRLIQRIDWTATARFDKANAAIAIHIGKGTTMAVRGVEMLPTEKWREEHARELVLTSDGQFLIGTDRQSTTGTLSTLSGWADHPDFIYESEWLAQ